jgi:hypothetical protein
MKETNLKHNALPGIASPITIADANFNAQTVGVQNWTGETHGTAIRHRQSPTRRRLYGGFGYIFQVLPNGLGSEHHLYLILLCL